MLLIDHYSIHMAVFIKSLYIFILMPYNINAKMTRYTWIQGEANTVFEVGEY